MFLTLAVILLSVWQLQAARNSKIQIRVKPWPVTHHQRNWAILAWSVPNHMSDLNLLEKKLQAKQIRTSWTEAGCANLSVEVADFKPARMIATNAISRNSLTVKICTDTNAYGYEIFEKGKKVGEMYF